MSHVGVWLKYKVKNHMILRKVLLPFIRRFQQARQFLLLAFRGVSLGNHIAPPHEVFYVRTDEIVWLTDFYQDDSTEIRNRNFPMNKYRGAVVDGDWDALNYRFDQLSVTQAIADRVNKNIDWRETNFFSECMRDIQSGRVLWGCCNDVQLAKRLTFIDEIIADMKVNGYKSGSESLLPGEDPGRLAKHPKYSDEITINIGRNGDYLFQDGRHRLAIAKALGIKVVPVKVLVRHAVWCKKLLNNNGLGEGTSTHLDLQYIKRIKEK